MNPGIFSDTDRQTGQRLYSKRMWAQAKERRAGGRGGVQIHTVKSSNFCKKCICNLRVFLPSPSPSSKILDEWISSRRKVGQAAEDWFFSAQPTWPVDAKISFLIRTTTNNNRRARVVPSVKNQFSSLWPTLAPYVKNDVKEKERDIPCQRAT